MRSPDIDQESPGVDWGELVLALVVVVFGGLVVWQTTQIRLTPAYSQVGPRVIPYVVRFGLMVLGVWLAVEAVIGRRTSPTSDSEDADPILPTDWRTVGLLSPVLIVYLVLIERAGFVILSALLYAGGTFAMGSRRIVRDIVAGVVIAIVLYVGFTRGLSLRLPAGVLDGLL